MVFKMLRLTFDYKLARDDGIYVKGMRVNIWSSVSIFHLSSAELINQACLINWCDVAGFFFLAAALD